MFRRTPPFFALVIKQSDTPPRSPATIALDFKPPSKRIKPVLKSFTKRDHNSGGVLPSDATRTTQDGHSDGSSDLNDVEYQDLQLALALSLSESRQRVGLTPAFNNAYNNIVSFALKDEIIPSEQSDTNKSVAGSRVLDEEEDDSKNTVKPLSDSQTGSSSQPIAEDYDEEAALMFALQESRREYEDKMHITCESLNNDSCVPECPTVRSEEEAHQKRWKGKERAYF